MEVPTSLISFSIRFQSFLILSAPTPQKLSGLRMLNEALSSHSSTLRNIELHFPSYTLENGESAKAPRTSLGQMSMAEFAVLWNLKLPVDALLGLDPPETATWSHLLPSSLQELYLDGIYLRTHRFLPVWRSHRIRVSLLSGITDILIRCPALQKVTINCLDEEDFEVFQKAATDLVEGLELVNDNIAEMPEIMSVSSSSEEPDGHFASDSSFNASD
jgi:hypothetical protein